MSWDIVRALIIKDFTLFFRNRFFAFISVLELVTYIVIYVVMPRTVDETLELAVYAPDPPPLLEQAAGQGHRWLHLQVRGDTCPEEVTTMTAPFVV